MEADSETYMIVATVLACSFSHGGNGLVDILNSVIIMNLLGLTKRL